MYQKKQFGACWGVVNNSGDWVVDAEWSEWTAAKLAARLNADPEIDPDKLFEGVYNDENEYAE